MEHSVVAGLPGWVGRRVVVRHRLPDGRATDALGELLHVDADALRIRLDRVPDGGDADVDVALADVLLAKPVPPPPARRSREDRRSRQDRRAPAADAPQASGSGPQTIRSPSE